VRISSVSGSDAFFDFNNQHIWAGGEEANTHSNEE